MDLEAAQFRMCCCCGISNSDTCVCIHSLNVSFFVFVLLECPLLYQLNRYAEFVHLTAPLVHWFGY